MPAPAVLFDVTDADFPQAVQRHPLLVVDAWVPWCAPCKRLEPILHELAAEYGGRVVIARLNTDDHPRTAQQLGIMGMPTLVLYRDGRRVGQVVGFQPKATLKPRLDDAFGLA